jgi:hypothetical protein
LMCNIYVYIHMYITPYPDSQLQRDLGLV